MKIPEHLLYEGITEEHKKKLEDMIRAKREKMREVPTFRTESEAVKVAVKTYKGKSDLPTIWKEPQDVGSGYAVVPVARREDAQNSGYTLVADAKSIADRANGRTGAAEEIDEIEEV